jgi:hypothetical protein
MPKARLARIELPDFGMPETSPELPDAIYPARIDRLRERIDGNRYDRLVVYADREHSANLAYLSGFDPRFEEALLVLGPAAEPALLVGNECFGMAGQAPLPMRRHLFQDFSLPSQPRDRSRPLAEILRDEGIADGSRVGVVGWKTYGRPDRTDLPAYLVDELRRLVGPSGTVENATDLLIDSADGLRVINEVEQLAAFEYAACQTSQGVRRLLGGLRPGMTEREAVRLLEWNGMPLSCHLMLGAGPRARLGLLSPTDRRIERGDPFTVAFGVWGALNCRAGFVVEDPGELPAPIRDYVDRLVAPYFEAVAEWYGALRIGQTGGALHQIIDRRLGDPFFGVFLNPGTSSTWTNGSIRRLRAIPRSSSGPGWCSRSTSSRRPGPTISPPTSRTAWPWPTRRRGMRSPRPFRPPRRGSRPGAGSCSTRSASTCTRTSCRSRTCRPSCRHSCSDRISQ